MADSKEAVLRALWRDKMHVEPAALDLIPPSVRATYDHIWQPAEMLMVDLQVLPLGLLAFWRDAAPGHLVFTHRPSAYRPGLHPWRDTTLDGLCEISVIDLRQDKGRAMRACFNLLDHLLGSGGASGGPWLSDRAGVTAGLRALGQRLARLYGLGHWRGEFAAQDAHDYLAHAWWLYTHDPRRLNTVDPLVYRLLASTLMNEQWHEDQR